MKSYIVKILLVSLIVIASSCENNPNENPIFTDNFDRAALLEFWADEVIVPAYVAYGNSIEVLNTETANFYDDSSISNLNELRMAWLNAYKTWQRASMFNIGKAEEIGLRNYTNIYPADVELIQSNIDSEDYNLELPSNFSAQGFPALEYLLYGDGSDDTAIISNLVLPKVKSYFQDLVTRMNGLSLSVVSDWNQGFRDAFVENSGSSGTASTDKLVNDFLFYYEKFLRAAKVGIPAGKFSSNNQPDLVEGRYSKIYSKQLFEQGFTAVQNFFNGRSYDNTTQGISLKQYLDEVHQTNNTDFNIADDIISQWKTVEDALTILDDDFSQQVLDDNDKMLAFFDELQKAVVPLKVDMLQALNIQVDFIDADGD